MGGGSICLPLRQQHLLILHHCKYLLICCDSCKYVFIFVIKRGRFKDLGESVMCDKDGLLSL